VQVSTTAGLVLYVLVLGTCVHTRICSICTVSGCCCLLDCSWPCGYYR
jgi:hypothetical protein